MQVSGSSGLSRLYKQGTSFISSLFLLVLFCFYIISYYLCVCVQTEELADCHVQEGFFISPLEHLVPGILPQEAVKARYKRCCCLPLQ